MIIQVHSSLFSFLFFFFNNSYSTVITRAQMSFEHQLRPVAHDSNIFSQYAALMED